MKSGKIILGLAAAVVTVGSSLAFKTAHKFSTHKVFVRVNMAGKCVQCKGLWTNLGNAVHNTYCTTIMGAKVPGTGANRWTFFTKLTAVNHTKCSLTSKINKTSISF